LYELDRVLDNNLLRARARHILEMVEHMPFDSIHSSRLWKVGEFQRDVFDLLNKIDLEVGKLDKLESSLIEMYESDVNEADRVGIASDLFGMQTSEKDGVTRVVGAVNHFVNRYNAMLRAITLYGDRATTSAEFKARATDALAKLDKMKTAVVGNVPFISRNELKAET
jgi:hypothetical protein